MPTSSQCLHNWICLRTSLYGMRPRHKVQFLVTKEIVLFDVACDRFPFILLVLSLLPILDDGQTGNMQVA
jgi:hypothetical protein